MDHALVVFLDGDGSCDPADVAALERAAASGADLVLGRRERMQPGPCHGTPGWATGWWPPSCAGARAGASGT